MPRRAGRPNARTEPGGSLRHSHYTSATGEGRGTRRHRPTRAAIHPIAAARDACSRPRMHEGHMPSDITQRVGKVIARTFQVADTGTSSEFQMGNPTAWDSVGHMGLILELEDEFGITFATYEMATLQTVPDIVRAIEAKVER